MTRPWWPPPGRRTVTTDSETVETVETTATRLARYYDLDLLDDPGDLDLYLAMAERTGGPVLELAAGSGRLAVPLARAGYAVTAVDNAPEMPRRAQAAWAATWPTGRDGARR